MMRIFTAVLALVFAGSLSALAAEPLPADAKVGISKALEEIGCNPGDKAGVEEGVGWFSDGATCGDDVYDIVLDKNFKIVDKKKK